MKTPIGEMWLDDEGILWHRLDALVVSPRDAEQVRDAVIELTGGVAVPAVIDIRSIAYAERLTRAVFASSAEESNELATALIVSSTQSQVMASLFMNQTKPERPVELFTSEAEAVEWARSFKADPNADDAD